MQILPRAVEKNLIIGAVLMKSLDKSGLLTTFRFICLLLKKAVSQIMEC